MVILLCCGSGREGGRLHRHLIPHIRALSSHWGNLHANDRTSFELLTMPGPAYNRVDLKRDWMGIPDLSQRRRIASTRRSSHFRLSKSHSSTSRNSQVSSQCLQSPEAGPTSVQEVLKGQVAAMASEREQDGHGYSTRLLSHALHPPATYSEGPYLAQASTYSLYSTSSDLIVKTSQHASPYCAPFGSVSSSPHSSWSALPGLMITTSQHASLVASVYSFDSVPPKVDIN